MSGHLGKWQGLRGESKGVGSPDAWVLRRGCGAGSCGARSLDSWVLPLPLPLLFSVSAALSLGNERGHVLDA